MAVAFFCPLTRILFHGYNRPHIAVVRARPISPARVHEHSVCRQALDGML